MANDNDNGLPFALMLWIKRQQEEKRQHAEYMVKRNAKDDETYMDMMVKLYTDAKLTLKDKLLLKSLSDFKTEGKNFSTAQKSMIAVMFYSKIKH